MNETNRATTSKKRSNCVSRSKESDTAALLRWWDAAEDCWSNDLRGRILRAVTEALESEGLAKGGSLTKAGKALLRLGDR